ncbi:hypothetical protein [Labilibaculum euxinus]
METTSVAIYSGAEHHSICSNKSSKKQKVQRTVAYNSSSRNYN